MDVDEPGPEWCFVRFTRRSGEREQGAAVVTRAERDDPVLVGASPLHPILAGQLQRRLDCLRPTTKEVELREVTGQRVRELVGEVLDGTVGEHRA